VLPPFNSFFPHFALHGPHFPAAWLIGCVILNATLQLKWIAVSSRLALATWRIGSCQWRLPIQFYISYTYIYQFIAFFRGSCSQLCVFGLSMGLTHNRCSNFIAFPPFTFAGKYLFLFIYICFCKINFTLGRLNAIQSGMLGPKTFVCVRVWQE